MAKMISGILLGLVSIWGGCYFFAKYAETWAAVPIQCTATLGGMWGVSLFCAGLLEEGYY